MAVFLAGRTFGFKPFPFVIFLIFLWLFFLFFLLLLLVLLFFIVFLFFWRIWFVILIYFIVFIIVLTSFEVQCCLQLCWMTVQPCLRCLLLGLDQSPPICKLYVFSLFALVSPVPVSIFFRVFFLLSDFLF